MLGSKTVSFSFANFRKKRSLLFDIAAIITKSSRTSPSIRCIIPTIVGNKRYVTSGTVRTTSISLSHNGRRMIPSLVNNYYHNSSTFRSTDHSSSSGKGYGNYTYIRIMSTSSNNNNQDNEQPVKTASNVNDTSSSSSPSPPTNNKTKSSSSAASSSSIYPGLVLASGTAVSGFTVASLITSMSGIPLSGIPVSIILGIGLRNYVLPLIVTDDEKQFDTQYKPGLTVATKTILQTGIVCVAAKLSLVNDILLTSTASLPVVLGSVSMGLIAIPFLGRVTGLSSELSKLIAIGTSICGVTAITALAPAINASSRDVTIAVATTVAFGTVGMLVLPYLFHTYGVDYLTSEQIGMCLGIGIHDTSQVFGAALAYKETYNDDVVFQVAAVTKLLRNLGLTVIIPALTYFHHKEQLQQAISKTDTSNAIQPSTMMGLNTFSKYVPPFLMAFLGMSLFRTTGDYYFLIMNPELSTTELASAFKYTMDWIGNDATKYTLGTAMAGVGLSTTLRSLQGVGYQPFVIGFTGATVVTATGITLATILA